MHLNNFDTKIRFGDIDEKMIARIRNYLSDQKGRKGKLEASTIKFYFNKFKVVLTHAARKDYLLDPVAVEQYFEDVTIPVAKKKEGQHLEVEEIQALRRLEFTKSEGSLARDMDIFLFQVYTGFYYNDLQILKKTQFFMVYRARVLHHWIKGQKRQPNHYTPIQISLCEYHS